MDRPSRRMSPFFWLRLPAIEFISVDLPAPLGPSRQTISPLFRSRSTSCSICAGPIQVSSDRTSSMGAFSKIRIQNQRVVAHVFGRAFADQAAVVQDADVMRQAHDDAHIMFDQ